MRYILTIYNKTYHNITCPVANSYKYMAKQSCVFLLIIGLNIIFLYEGAHELNNRHIYLCPNIAMVCIYYGMCSSCIEANKYFAIFISSHRILTLVTIIIGLLHTADRLHRYILKASNPYKTASNLVLLIFQLLHIIHMHNLTATAFISDRTSRFNPIPRGMDKLY